MNAAGRNVNPNPFSQQYAEGATAPTTVGIDAQGNNYTSGTGTNNSNTDNHPVLSATGQWVSSTSGQAWHGSYQNPNGTTQYFSNGKAVSDIGQVGVQTPNIQVQEIQKNPQISSQVAGAVQNNAATSGQMSKSFNQYLDEAQNLGASGAQQLKDSQAAINPSGTISRLNADVSNVSGQLGDTLNKYTTAQNQNQSNVIDANKNYQTTQDAALGTLKSDLTNENAAYGTAAQNVANQAYANAMKQIKLYQLGTGTATSNSGNLDNRYIGAYENVNIPLQQDLANRALATTNQVYNLGSNLQNQYLSNTQNQFSQQGALNSDIANRTNTNNQYLTGLDQNTASQVQQLQQTVATMQPQLAMQYLASLGIPIQMAQAIMAGNTSNLAALTNLDQQANTYNLYSPYQNNAPGFTSPRVTLPSYGGGTGTGANMPYSGVADALQSQLAQQQGAQAGYTFKPTAPPAGYYPQSAGNNYQSSSDGSYGPMKNLSFDQNSGIYTDPLGNQWTNSGNHFTPYPPVDLPANNYGFATAGDPAYS